VASQTVVNLCSSVTVVSTRAQILWLDSKVLKYFQHEIAIKSLNLKKYAHLVTVLTECACFFSFNDFIAIFVVLKILTFFRIKSEYFVLLPVLCCKGSV